MRKIRPALPPLLQWAILALALVPGALCLSCAAADSEPKGGKAVFIKACAPCHSADGKAKTPAARKLGVKDLSESKLADAQIVEMIQHGKLKNQASTKMPAFQDRLTQAEIESLVPVVKAFRK